MKISSIKIVNFRGIKNTTLVPEHLNVFMGQNGSGKTSILNAITFALTGDMKSEYIQTGAKSAVVEITFADGSSIERKKVKSGNTSCKVNGKSTTGKSANEFIESKLGVSAETYRAMVGVDYIAALSQKDLSAFFLSLLPVQMKFGRMMEIVGEITQQYYYRDPSCEEVSYMKELFQNVINNDESYGIEFIKQIYDELYMERRNLNAVIKNLSAKCEFDESTLPTETKEELEKALYEVAADETKNAEYQKKLTAYQNSVKVKKDAEARIKKLVEEAAQYESILKPDEEGIVNTEINKKKYEAYITKSQSMLATFQANVDMFQKTLDNLDKPVCPISEKLVCTTDKRGLKKELSKLLAENQAHVKEHQEFKRKCRNLIVKCEAFIKSYNESKLLWSKKELIEKQISEFVMPIVLEKPEEIKQDTDSFLKKQEINRKLGILSAYELVKKNKLELEEMNKKHALIEFALLVLDTKKGVPAEVLKVTLNNFAVMCNEHAAKIKKGLSLKFLCDDGFEVLARTKENEEFLPVSTISTGEKLIVIYLLMLIINKITNAKYLCIDNLDKLDAECTKTFVELLGKTDMFEHIFIGAVNHSDTEALLKGVHVLKL